MKTRWSGLATRIVAAMAVVILVSTLATVVAELLIGPPLFQHHLAVAGLDHDRSAVVHAEQAFRSTNALAAVVAVACSATIAVVVSVVLARRMSGSLRDLFTAASRTSRGKFELRVAVPNLGDEFDQVAVAFNQMSDTLAASAALRHRLFADVAHELRTPVATIRAVLESVEDGIKDLDASTIAMLNLHLDRITRLAADITAVSQAEESCLELNPERVPVSRLISDAIEAVGDKYADAEVELTANLPESIPDFTVDAARIGQILGNLLDNALRHTPADGRVTIKAWYDRKAKTITIAVVDTGDGIPAEHLPHIFERFYRVDNARDRDHGGSGIGLSIVKALTEAHGGTVRATSDGPGYGTTISICLPNEHNARPQCDRPIARPLLLTQPGET